MIAPLVAATISSGLVGEPPRLWVPPKPAIIKTENVEFSKNLLAMPLSLGLIAQKNVAARTVTYRTSQAFGTLATSFTVTSAAIGTASSDRIVVVIASTSNSIAITSCTLAGAAMTKAAASPAGTGSTAIFYLSSTSGTTATVVASTGGSTTRACIGVYTVLLGTTSATPSATQTVRTTTGTTGTLPSVTVPAGGVFIAGMYSSASTGAVTWTGATENYDLVINAATGASGASGTTTGTVNVSVSGSSGIWAGAIAVW